MSSKEEKLLAARKKLREFQGKTKTIASEYIKDASSLHDSEAVESINNNPDENDILRSESPFYSSRLAWERRKTLPVSDEASLNQPPSRPCSESSDKLTNEPSDDETEVKLLRDQQRRQTQAMNILVGERSNALSAVSRMESELRQKSDELNEFKSRYIEVSQRVLDLENVSRQNSSNSLHNSRVEDDLRHSLETSNQTLSAYQEQLSEQKTKMNVKTTECDQLAARVRDLANSLSVANIKIQQLTIDEHSTSNVREKELQDSNETFKQKVELLERRLQAAAMEGEQSTHRFQMYADQCNVQQDALRAQIRELSQEKNQLKTYLAQLQYEFDEFKSNAAKTSNEIDTDIVTAECETLRERLQTKETEVENIRAELDESLESLKNVTYELENSQLAFRRLEASVVSGTPNPALLAAMESDKVAASRAVAQNQNLKEQLSELQEAFVRLSNEKLVLTDKLSHAEHESVELRKQSHDHSHDNQGHDSGDSYRVEDETNWDIDMYRRVVETLRKDKTELILRYQALQKGENATSSPAPHRNGHGHSHSHEDSDDCHSHSHEHHEDINYEKLSAELSEHRRNVKQLQLDKEELLKRLGGQAEDPQIQGLLETKLKRTMDDIAALDEEKQRLEHLVLQLQGETETIGEYIALYHKQRLLLKQRALEKDEQLEQLTKDREELKEKLVSLNELIAKLIGNEPRPNTNGESTGQVEEDTAKRIQDLITEIGNNNVVNSHSIAFEQCSCCSGRRLITV